MKRTILLLILGISAMFVNAQKENGIVYSEHESIAKTKALWAAFVKGDRELYESFFADSVWEEINGNFKPKLKKEMGNNFVWWKNFENLTVNDAGTSTPDAINYTIQGLWVQDWILIKGTHTESGINISIPMHNLYSFNKEGKINSIHYYFDTSILDEINKSQRTIENGTVYINHPYIVTVRKLVNAYCAENINLLKEFYAPDCVFSGSDFKMGETINLETKLKSNETTFDEFDNLKLTQVGYPDCIYYQKDDIYTVYSWWSLSCINKSGKKFSKIPVMISNTFNKDGKITMEVVYSSGIHFQ